ADEKAAVGQIIGKALKHEEVPGAVKTIVDTYRTLRSGADEKFIEAVERLGVEPFQEAIYATD
ncbi:MAG: nitrite/sulfite reductase, partial [Pseudomonadota bacterium]